jgi:hypothetical protein
MVGTVLAGRRTATPALGSVAPDAFRPVPAVAGASTEVPLLAEHRGFEVPGTLVLAVAFLMLFIVLYAISWVELTTIPWRIN